MSSVLANEQVNLEDGNSLAQTQYRHMERALESPILFLRTLFLSSPLL